MIVRRGDTMRLLLLLVLLSCSRLIDAGGVMDFFGLGGEIEDNNENNNNNNDNNNGNNSNNEDNDSDECTLQCQNGSACQRGRQDLSGHMASTSGSRLNFHKELHRNGWYCSCPVGYTGLECQTEFQTCADNKRVCYHGSICKTDSSTQGFYGTGESRCDCDAAAASGTNSLIMFSGQYCQTAYVNTKACKRLEFCQNGGTCQDDPQQPCECLDGFSGTQCETVIDQALSCEESQYCRNGGTCTNDPNKPCECPNGYFGFKCQFAKEVVVIPECQKACMNGGECQFEEDDPNSNTTSAFLMRKQYCSCPETQSGEFCEKTNEKCGDQYCQNGGECFEVPLSSRKTEHMCDCLPGYTEKEVFSGEFCQYVSTSFCSPADDPNGRQFCTNGGICPPQGGHGPCDCPKGFSGPRCSFQEGVDGSDYAECDLPCMNGGTCQKGMKDLDQVYARFSDDIADILNETHSDFEHCSCPVGFYGIRCEYEVEECSGTHVCFHGSSCKETATGSSSCVCEDSYRLTAGLFCEFFATQECDESLAPPAPGHRGFCTNGGLCVVTDGELGCSCPEGFDGPHCEYRIIDGNSTPSIEHSKESRGNTSRTTKISIIASAFGASAIVVIFMGVSWIKSRRAAGSASAAAAAEAPPADGIWKDKTNLAPGETTSRPEVSTQHVRETWDGMTNVEII